MKKSKILVIDDTKNSTTKWAEQIKEFEKDIEKCLGKVTIEPVDVEMLPELITELESRRKSLRGTGKEEPKKESELDKCVVLVVDFDLIDAWVRDKEGQLSSDITGERIAYLARCFSNCGYIIALNQFDHGKSFDLTLRGHIESFADLNIAADFIGASGIWRGLAHAGGKTEFHPWYWPVVPQAASDFEKCVVEIESVDVTPILPLTGLTEDDIAVLPPEALDPLSRGIKKSSKPLIEWTTNDFIEKAVPFMKNAKDELSEANKKRVVAARIRSWIHWMLLPSQNPISDIPHLVMRIPELLKEKIDAQELEELTKPRIANLKKMFGKNEVLVKNYLLRNECQKWWPVTVVDWRRLIEDDKVYDLRMQKRQMPDAVFCEDISAFVTKEKTRSFRSNVLSAYRDRCIIEDRRISKEVVYSPGNRLAM